jgi:hypothetical protein
MTPTEHQNPEGGLVQRVEVLLSSLTAVVSARVILDEEKGAQVHIIATSEMPVSEVSQAVMSALTWGLGFDVPSNQITVVQSSLSREELKALLGSEGADSSPASTARTEPTSVESTLETAPLETATPETATPETSVPEKAAADQPDPKAAVPDTGLVEFSLGGTQGEPVGATEAEFRRLELQDLQLEKHPQGGFGISVRLADNDRSIGAQREAAGTEEDSLEVPASAALGVIQEFLRAERNDGLSVVLRFLAARRLRHPQHDVVVVLVEAVVRGRRIPLTGAASAHDGVERASIMATLQATNAFVAGTLTANSANGATTQ